LEGVSHSELNKSIEAVWRLESARVIAVVARITRDVGVAEELAQDAMLAAIEQWPVSGVPDNPAAWITATAKHRAIDYVRRAQRIDIKHRDLAVDIDAGSNVVIDALVESIDDDIGDDMLRLMFVTCHPMLSKDARVALTLRLLGGLSTAEIARAFLTTEPTIAQRIVRAKRTLADARVSFEVPRGTERVERIAAVLEVIYLVFNEGYSATSGDDVVRPAMCEDALRLGRMLARLAPDDSEVHALAGLMEIQASRLPARTADNGDAILLMDQDRTRWDRLLIHRGLTAVARAYRLTDAPGPYLLQAAIAACHARAPRASETDWAQIVALYGQLSQLTQSPVVELNRAIAVSMAGGPSMALPIIDSLVERGELSSYHFLWAARGDLLVRLARHAEAAQDLTRAAALTSNARERLVLRERARQSLEQSESSGDRIG
jgi:RNA polymerase sigma factor (sigma-70 family)